MAESAMKISIENSKRMRGWRASAIVPRFIDTSTIADDRVLNVQQAIGSAELYDIAV